jgi:hypothetical protein
MRSSYDIEDEYDTYLLAAAGKLVNGHKDSIAVDYLVHIETAHMGLDEASNARARAMATVKRISEILRDKGQG